MKDCFVKQCLVLYLVVLCAVEHPVKAERGKWPAFSLVELVLELNPENEALLGV